MSTMSTAPTTSTATTATNEPAFLLIGPHRVRAEESDTVFIIYNGVVGREHLREYFELLDSVESPYVIILEDLGNLVEMASDTRREILDNAPRYSKRIRSVVCYNGTFRARVLITMLVRATNLLGATGIELHFVADEAEARKVIEKERARLKKQYQR